jgi:hypothetical protein
MQQKQASVEKDLLSQFNDLIISIKSATGLNEEEISKRLKYNEGYIAQTKSRGNPNGKLIENLKREFRDELQYATQTLHEPQVEYTKKSLDELIISNRVLAEANKTLAESHLIISKNNEDLIQMAKAAFNLLPQVKDPLSLVDPGTNVAGAEGFAPASGNKGNVAQT